MSRQLANFKAEFFKALAHPIRIRILDCLRGGEKGVRKDGAGNSRMQIPPTGIAFDFILVTLGLVVPLILIISRTS
jgi:DNA-binding transcriptional ArsR family regulator